MDDIFFEIHDKLPRESPGSDEATGRAWWMLAGLPDAPRLLDIGSGPGAQTLALTKLSRGPIIALDNHLPYLQRLSRAALNQGVGPRISCVVGTMFALPFRDESFDIVWSEGAIYLMGFERGLTEWSRVLKPGGYLAVSELTWLADNPPDEVCDFWQAGYPAMSTLEGNLAAIDRAGYAPIGHFILPEQAWWDEYYGPMGIQIAHLKECYRKDPNALYALEEAWKEIMLYMKYSQWYGCVFYILRKE